MNLGFLFFTFKGHEDSGLVLEQINLYERVSPLLPGENAFPERQVCAF